MGAEDSWQDQWCRPAGIRPPWALQQLVFIINVYQGKKLKITGVPLEGEVTVGRERTNRVVLPVASVSRHHATFLFADKDGERQVLLRDTGSTNGCEVNG